MTIKVDLLDKPGRRMGFDPMIFFLIIIVIISVVLFYFYGNTLSQKITVKKKEIAEVEEKIRKIEGQIPKIRELEEVNRELETQINIIKQLVYDPIRYANLLDELAFIIPKNIYVSKIDIDPNKKLIKFSGESVGIGGEKPLKSISDFMQNIQNSRYFKTADLSGASRGKAKGGEITYKFNITTQYDPDAATTQ
ncbi:MAG: PilN domain-containing protein [Vulcanimicrobiota bacterium]